MPKTSNGSHLSSQRRLLEAAFTSYLRVAMRKHALPPDLLDVSDPTKLSDVELDAAVTMLKDLAHLPPG